MANEIPDLEVDAKGLFCPLPILRLARALAGKPSGTVALLKATDPAAVPDVDTFCREGGHVLLETKRDGDVLSFLIRKSALRR